MEDLLTFANCEEFRTWLGTQEAERDGVWLLFEKGKGAKTLTAAQALEEALCFGWIDGQMQSLDEKSYKKYFAPRRSNSKWSEKNKALVLALEKQGKMTEAGRAKIAQAKKNGQWDAPKAPAIAQEQIDRVAALLAPHETAAANFAAMSPSVKRTYTRAYLDAKTPEGQEKRLAWMVERLNKNLKPM